MTQSVLGRVPDAEEARGSGAAEAGRRRRRIQERIVRGLLGILGFAIVVAGWYAVDVFGLFKPGLLPSPHEVGSTIIDRFSDGTIWAHIRTSVWRVTVGVLIGVGAAVPVGFVLGWYATAAKIFNPVVSFFRALPPIALIPLVVVYFGIGEVARTSVLVYAAFFSGVIVIYEGVRSLEPIYIRAARTLGATQLEIFYRVVLRMSVPTILVAFRVALGVAWATLVAAELIAAQQGLGAMIQEAGNFFRIPVIYAGIILIGIAALVMDGLLKVISRRLIRWREEVTE